MRRAHPKEGVLGALVCVWLVACGGTPSTPDDAGPVRQDAGVFREDAGGTREDGGGPPPAEIETRTESRDTGASGEIEVTVSIDRQRSFIVLGTSETNARLAVVAIDDPSGTRILRWQDWYNEPYALTNAFWARQPATVINWPVRANDPALVPGDYVVTIGSYRIDGITSRPDVPVDVTTMISSDHDLERGLVRVVLVWAAGLDADAELVAATEAAVAHWREVWVGAGMDLEVRYASSTIDPALPYPGAAAGDVILAGSSYADPGEIAVVIGEIINDTAGQYGVSGGIPGPLVRSTMSAIVIGWLANAGGDGVFSANDVQLYGEVLAHEVGHYVGLYHPVSDTYDYWDSLADTPECTAQRECNTILGSNLMFPYSICDAGICLSTTLITANQREVMQRYTGTL